MLLPYPIPLTAPTYFGWMEAMAKVSPYFKEDIN